MSDHFVPINFDKYQDIVSDAIKRKAKGIATKEDVTLVELFDIAYNQYNLNELLRERVAIYYQAMDAEYSRNLKFLQGHCYDNDEIQQLLKPYIETSKFKS
jgi:hypothetical protein